ncbi:major allergen Pru av 1 [Quercus suber]|uniref:major allergen Pru av 1 n=1 Tax=Quercus suber TaxID=58331 RepID=UPI0032DE65FB
MGVITYESENAFVIPPARLFKAFVLDSDNLIPKVEPQAIKSTEIIEGNGGPGTIRKITFSEGHRPHSYLKQAKHRTDVLDPENFTYSFSVIEGDALFDKLEKISTETKIVASPDRGSIVKTTSKYQTKGDIQLPDEQIREGKEKASRLFRAVEAYLVAHPDLYN